jgi:hypothetical protein
VPLSYVSCIRKDLNSQLRKMEMKGNMTMDCEYPPVPSEIGGQAIALTLNHYSNQHQLQPYFSSHPVFVPLAACYSSQLTISPEISETLHPMTRLQAGNGDDRGSGTDQPGGR